MPWLDLDHSVAACLRQRHIHIGAILSARSVCAVSHMQHHANCEASTTSLFLQQITSQALFIKVESCFCSHFWHCLIYPGQTQLCWCVPLYRCTKFHQWIWFNLRFAAACNTWFAAACNKAFYKYAFLWTSDHFSWPLLPRLLLRSERPSGMCTKLCTVAASNKGVHTPRSLCYYLFAPHRYIVVLRAHPIHGESHNQCNTTGEVATTSPPLYKPHQSHLLCVKAEPGTTSTSWSQHHFVDDW